MIGPPMKGGPIPKLTIVASFRVRGDQPAPAIHPFQTVIEFWRTTD